MQLARSTPAALAVFILAATGGRQAAAQALPFRCGPDCSTPGRYVLCNDSFDTQPLSAGGVQLVDFLEAACASFPAPAASFQLTGFVAAFGPDDMLIALLEVFEEAGTNQPGALITDTGVGVPSSPVAGFSGLFFTTGALSAPFRLCLRQQLDDPVANLTIRPLLTDGDGVQGQNTAFVPNVGWSGAQISGDLVLRAIVEYPDLAPWSPGGACVSPDAGVSPLDATVGPDAAAGPGDAGAQPDAAPHPDAADLDATPAGDAQGGDATVIAPGDDGGTAQLPPPQISAISPKQGLNTTPVDVLVSGANFSSGLTLKIGTIRADQVQVPGPTTILAQVPANIAPATYDVIVQNPDGQSAILSDGYTVLGADGTGSSEVADQCGCTSTRAGGGAGFGALLLGALFLRRGPRRCGPQG